MKLDRFINRPVLSTVISILIVILGILGLLSLPITQYPDIAPPTVSVRATYTGANAQTVLNSVIAPLEDQINGVENMMYMTSSASNNGSAEISIYFKQGTDPDMAAVNVQNRVSMAQGLLPAEVTKIGVTTQKRQNSMLIVFSVYDAEDRYDQRFIENYAKINLIPEVQRVPGVGDANVLGTDYSMRIWLKPDVMAQYKLVPNDVAGVLAEQNVEAAPGSFGEQGNQSFQYTIRYKGRLQEVNEFENMVVKALPDGEVLRLKDIADIELGRLTYNFVNKVNGHSAVTCIVYQMAGTNATETINNIQNLLEETEKILPPGLKIDVGMNANDFLYASIHEVLKTLIEAFILVFIVINLKTGNRNPMLLSFGVEVRIERAMVRVGTVVIAVREDLNDVLALHGIPCRINKALALEFRIGVVVVVLLLEEEVFVFDVVDGREFGAAVVVVEDVAVFVNLLQIGAEAVVDDLDAGGDQSIVAGLKEVVIREGTIVGVVRAAGVGRIKLGTPGHTVHADAVSVTGVDAGATRAVVVVDVWVVGAINREFIALVIFVSILGVGTISILRVAFATLRIGALNLDSVPTIAGKFLMRRQEAGVHHANLDALTVVAKRIGGGGLHRLEAPILVVFGCFPRLLGRIDLSRIVGNKARILASTLRGHIGCRCSTGTEHERRHCKRHGALRRLGLRCVLFVGDDVLLMSHAPLGLEYAIHLFNSI